MTKFTFSLLFAFLAFSSFAQDIKIAQVTPNSGSRIKAEQEQEFVITVESVTNVSTGTVIPIYYSWGLNDLKQSESAYYTNFPLGPGDKFKVTVKLETPVESADSVSLTFKAVLGGDQDESNNFFGLRYLVSNTLENDIEVSIVSPQNNVDLKNWSNVEFELEVINRGVSPLKNGTDVLYELFINEASIGGPKLAVYEGDELNLGDKATVTLNVPIPKDVQLGTNATVCLVYTLAKFEGPKAVKNEDDYENNNACGTYNILINSIEETSYNINSLSYKNGVLFVDLLNNSKSGNYTFRIISANGQEQVSKSFNIAQNSNFNAQIELPYVSKGLYIVRVYANNEFVGNEKFLVY
jgi:hypothetical protein